MAKRSRNFILSVDDHGTIKAALGVSKAFGDPVGTPILKALTAGSKAGGETFAKRLLDATSTWEHEPDITVFPGPMSMTRLGSSVSYVVNSAPPSEDNPYPWVDQGTRGPYLIEAKNAPYLAFQSGFTPKTNPGSLTAGPGGASGPMVYAKAVMHPGIKARNITQRVADLVKDKIQDDTERLVTEALEAWEG